MISLTCYYCKSATGESSNGEIFYITGWQGSDGQTRTAYTGPTLSQCSPVQR